ncbi:uncharacterized protein PV09_04310 [Verruconis gallopava]|uniref:ribonuclease T2 n=1 Tax=Verruconis gallopava TaxID=253628 RepID=A0A0D2ACG4_9PEZI|nr:uncharacterized protein PV09_04310 [Verruconis gallopava]KIW04558.1 hypothetical protein PV09_04310 [Verruconis gallopava]
MPPQSPRDFSSKLVYPLRGIGESRHLPSQSWPLRIMPRLKIAAVALTVGSVCYAFAFPLGLKPVTPLCTAKDLATLSCSSGANLVDSCCVEKPGGLLLLTQLYNPELGPSDSWTIHGLWGDYCNGSFPTSCDASRDYKNIPAILKRYGQDQLLDYMSTMWLNDAPVTTVNGSDADLWAHEWSKHGTCMSTLRSSCYSQYTRAQEVVDYYTSTVRLFETLPTWVFLNNCGISPSPNVTYALADIERCLKRATGDHTPHIGCNKGGSLNEVWYYFHWVGKIADGHVVGTESTFNSTCPVTGIKYLPKVTQMRA